MSSEPVIAARGLGKAYPMYARPYHRLFELLVGRSRGRWRHEHRALDGVDFEIRAGECVGIVGSNGAGKSTLLQLLCGTLTPSEGSVEVRGRVAALGPEARPQIERLLGDRLAERFGTAFAEVLAEE